MLSSFDAEKNLVIHQELLHSIWLPLPLQVLSAQIYGKLRAGTAPLTDARIKLTSEAIQGARTMKQFGWEAPFRERIQSCRVTVGHGDAAWRLRCADHHRKRPSVRRCRRPTAPIDSRGARCQSSQLRSRFTPVVFATSREFPATRLAVHATRYTGTSVHAPVKLSNAENALVW